MAPRKSAKITDYPINTLVQIAATGGQSGDWWQRVALTGEVQIVGSYHHTIIQVINPDTEELTQLPWRTEWLSVLPEGEQLEEVEALQQTIARVRSEYSDSAIEQSSGNESDIPSESISQNQLEQTMVDELPPRSESSESEPVVAKVEVVEELTEEELVDRQRLELKVERAFYEAGKALAELQLRRLYRSTHKTFEEYCRDRFGMQRAYPYRLIDAAAVFDNLSPIGDIFPTAESQCRPLARLEPEEQRQVWQQAVKQTGGNVPTARIVKSIVERLKEQDTTPATIPYNPGDVFLVCSRSGPLRKYDKCWAIAIQINEYTVSVDVYDGNLIVKAENLEPILSPSECEQVRAIAQRITRLSECGLLDRGAYYVLEGIGRQTFLTEVEEGLLSWLENHYGVI